MLEDIRNYGGHAKPFDIKEFVKASVQKQAFYIYAQNEGDDEPVYATSNCVRDVQGKLLAQTTGPSDYIYEYRGDKITRTWHIGAYDFLSSLQYLLSHAEDSDTVSVLCHGRVKQLSLDDIYRICGQVWSICSTFNVYITLESGTTYVIRCIRKAIGDVVGTLTRGLIVLIKHLGNEYLTTIEYGLPDIDVQREKYKLLGTSVKIFQVSNTANPLFIFGGFINE